MGKQLELFYNTTHEEGDVLAACRLQAGSQNEQVLAYFRQHRHKHLSADDVWQALYGGTMVPLTSVRRAISTLTGEGYLRKTEIKKPGIYGRNVYCYKLQPWQR